MLRYRFMPVPAGMSLPMMTFSFSPSRASLRALMAASVSTRVVSWNEAADSHDSVASDALVIPMRTGRAEAGAPPDSMTRRFSASNAAAVDELTGQQVGVARLEDVHPAQHLPDDDLDVLVVDRHALRPVDLLHFLHHLQLHLAQPEDAQRVVRVHRAFDQLLPDAHPVALADEQLGAAQDRVGLLVAAVVRDDDDLLGLVGLLDPDPAVVLADRRLALGTVGPRTARPPGADPG